MAFTENKDVNYKILMELDDSSLGKACQTNQYVKQLCQNEDFWRNRTIKVFGPVFSDKDDVFKYFNIYLENSSNPNKSWRDFYINLVDIRENYVNDKNKVIDKYIKNFPYSLIDAIYNYIILISRNLSKRIRNGDLKVEDLLDYVNDMKNKEFVSYRRILSALSDDENLIKLLNVLPVGNYDYKRYFLDSSLLSNKDFMYSFIDKLRKEKKVNQEDFLRMLFTLPSYIYTQFPEKIGEYVKRLIEENSIFDKETLYKILQELVRGNKNSELVFGVFDMILEKGDTIENIYYFVKDKINDEGFTRIFKENYLPKRRNKYLEDILKVLNEKQLSTEEYDKIYDIISKYK